MHKIEEGDVPASLVGLVRFPRCRNCKLPKGGDSAANEKLAAMGSIFVVMAWSSLRVELAQARASGRTLNVPVVEGPPEGGDPGVS